MNFRTAALFLLASATATATSSSSTSLAFVPGRPNGGNARLAKQQGKEQKQQLTPVFLTEPSAILPVIIFGGAVAATVYQQKQALKEAVGTKHIVTTPAVTPVATPAPAPVAKVVAKVAAKVAPKVAPKPAQAAVPAPAPVAVTVPAPAPVAKKAALAAKAKPKKDLAREVASTIEDRRDTEKVVQENKAKAAAKKAVGDAKVPGTTIPAHTAEVTETSGDETKKVGSKRRKAWRVVRKVVAPWRKWENIN
jgi:hypothetical protein